MAPVVFETLIDNGAKPAGLLAQTSMRIEKRNLAYGHDLDTDIDPIQAGLGFAVDWISHFIGKRALSERLEKQSVTRIMSLVFDQENTYPMGNEPVYQAERLIGKTTSAAFAYRLGKPLALATITDSETLACKDSEVFVDIAGERYSTKLINGAAW